MCVYQTHRQISSDYLSDVVFLKLSSKCRRSKSVGTANIVTANLFENSFASSVLNRVPIGNDTMKSRGFNFFSPENRV